MRILTSNLRLALRIAIKTQEEEERRMGYVRDSAFVGGLKEAVKAIDRGERIEVSKR